MLSLRSWNENSSTLGLVVDGRGRGRRRKFDMEKNEPEKHESYSGQEDDVNPDFLSYIDERIEDVLGHFQKEFQGGVPVENLGAQYGGYGSFLPSYQRCPSILSQPRSPEKISNHVSRSPYKLQPKDRHHKPSVPGTSPSSRASIESKEKPLEMSDKRKASISTHRAVGISHSLSKSVDIDDQKIPELCIKVGHDNGLTRNKPDIYSDLGLDFSPSPSLKDTPDGGEECSLESPDAFRESPTTILQIMTCLSVPEGYLSPLPDSLLHSTGKDDIFLKKNKTVFHHKGRTEAHVASSDNSLNGKFIRSYTCEKSKSKDKSQMLWESVKFLGTCDEVAILKKEPEAKTPVAHSAQGVITNALSREKRQTISDSEKEIFKDPDNESLKESAPLSDVKKDNLVGFVESTSNGVAGNSVINNIHYNASVNFKSSFTVETPEERFGSKQETSYAKAEMGSKNLKNYDTTKAKSSRYIGRKNHTTKPKEPVNTTYVMTVSSREKDVLSRIQEIDPAYEGGSTLKENTSNDKSLAEPLKENLTTISAAASNLKKGMLKASKLHKEDSNNKAIKYHTGFGISTCIQEADGNKHGSSRFIEKSKEKLQLNKVANLQIANSVTDALVFDPLTKNSQTSDATATVSPPVIEENWVCCDICQTWRLLPYGTNPDNLPTEWQCSMQVWMPGLNKCYISQDETTKAFHQLYQVPAPVNAINLSIHPDNSLSSIKSSGILDHNGRLENNVCSAPLGGKEKRVLMNASNLPRDSSLSYSNSGKNIQPSLGNKRLKHEGSLTQHRIRQMSTSGGHTIEKYDHKVEMPFKILASCPNEGDLFENYSKQSMSKCKRQVDKDDQRSSKKVKKDRLSHYEKDLHTEDSRVARKVLQSSGNQSHSSSVEHRKHVRASDAKHPDKYDFKDKKRELKELQESGTHHKNSMTSQRIANDRPMIKFGSSESQLRRLKKAKVEKFEGQDSSAVIFDGEVDKNGCQTRNKLYNIENYQPHKGDEGSIHALECVGAMKRDVTNVQPVAAATSSSSKVSGSQKRKVKLQEVRGSPVESVSSSPMRILNTKKNSRNLLTNNDDILNTSTLKGSSKCSSDGDVGGNSDQSGTVTKDPASISRLRVTKASKTAEPGVLDSFYTSNEYQGRKAKRLSVRKTGNGLYNHDDILSSDYGHANSVYDDENIINQLDRHPLMQSNTNHNCKQYERHDSGYQMPVKSSSFCRDSNKDCTFDSKKFKIKILNSYSDLKELDHLHLNKEDNLESYCKQHKVPDSRIIVAGARHTKLISQENLHQPSAHQRQDHSSQIVVERLEEKNGWGSQMALTSNNKRISRHYHVDSVNSRASKSAKQLRKSHYLNGTRPQPTASATKCSPLKKDGLTTVNAYIQEARELKHIADHLKNEGLGHESSGIYFEASLKFLHVASLMESTNSETAKQGELFPSQQMLQMYLETALLCEFCAREYENLKEMAAAALAYKCAEVAYMKVAYFKHPSASKDQHDLQAALDATLPDEPTSSSASDVDSLINQGDSEKAVSVRANGSPQIAGNHVIAAQNRPHVKRLLTFTNYINCAFEAANKSQNAIAIASIDLKNDRVESLGSVRKVLDFNFYNVEGLLQLIRISLNSISSKV